MSRPDSLKTEVVGFVRPDSLKTEVVEVSGFVQARQLEDRGGGGVGFCPSQTA